MAPKLLGPQAKAAVRSAGPHRSGRRAAVLHRRRGARRRGSAAAAAAGEVGMFTGIVQDVGRVQSRETRGGDTRLTIAVERLALDRTSIGDSICVQGVCLTVMAMAGKTLQCGCLARDALAHDAGRSCASGAGVNLEPALRAGDPLGRPSRFGSRGRRRPRHGARREARSLRVEFEAPAELARYIARKGSDDGRRCQPHRERSRAAHASA